MTRISHSEPAHPRPHPRKRSHTSAAAQPETICVAIQAESLDQMRARAAKALKDARFLEFRLDSLPHPGTAIAWLGEFLADHEDVTAIGTCRRKEHGGNYSGSLAGELEILHKAAEAGCRIVDLEVESAEEARPEELERFRTKLRQAKTELLVSFHDFAGTHALDRAAERIAAFEPELMKVVSTAHTLADNLPVLRLIEDRSRTTRVVGIAMGEEGLVSRVLGPREGGAFTFASLDEGAETAPGQVTSATMRDLYRADKLDAETRIFGVAGNPIRHSLSPLMQNTAFANEEVNAVLLPLRVRALTDLLTLMAELPMSGAAITMPLKQEVLPFLAHMDPLTARIGACNTLRADADGKLYGFNTDVAGVLRPLEKRLKLKGARVAVLGAGGAARAAVFGLVDAGAEVLVVNRTYEHAVSLAKAADATALKQDLLRGKRLDVLINSTPCGMAGAAQALPIREEDLNADWVFDMVYNPMETPLLKLARERGIPTIGGIEMFVQQGARQFEIWTGKAAPEADMQRVVEQALRRLG